MTTIPTIESRTALLAEKVQEVIDAYYEDKLPGVPKPIITVSLGLRYAKLVRTDSSVSAFCFVDQTNGNVLKAASWTRPAKHACSNVMNDDGGVSGVTVYGGNYL